MNRMVPFRYLFRAKLSQTSFSTQCRKLSMSHYRSSENKDTTEGEKIVDEKPSKSKQTEVNERLQLLIASMKVSTATALDRTELARPRKRVSEKKLLTTNKTEETAETERIATAAKEVAKSLGGDVEQTEIQLLSKVASQSAKVKAVGSSSSSSSSSSGSSSSSDDEASEPKKEPSKPVLPRPPEPEMKTAKSRPSKGINLTELIVGMTIDRKQKPKVKDQRLMVQKAFDRESKQENQQWQERDRNNREIWHERGNRKEERGGNRKEERGNYKKNRTSMDLNAAPIQVKLFGAGERLNIFDVNKPGESEVDQLATWRTLKEREMKLAVAHPPKNHFEELIMWTEQGKIWKFPIDNEQGMEEERGVSFADHVFLEGHLEPWCPRKGPIRHFMELVCVGLSKNHHLRADEKRAHIEWFRDYFDAKREILLETGALGEIEAGGERRAVA